MTVVCIEIHPYCKPIQVGRLYEVKHGGNGVSLINVNGIVENTMVKPIPNPMLKALTKSHSIETLETGFALICNFKKDKIQKYLSQHSLGLMEHMEKWTDEAKKNLFQPFEELGFSSLELDKMIKIVKG